MSLRRIAIACQGGGSQCAFVAGSLKALFARQIQHRYEVIGLSGTSGGAFTAALAWAGLLLQAQGDPTPIEDRIIACWRDLTAQTPLEIAFDTVSVELLRLVERGVLPSVAMSPSSLSFQLWERGFSQLVSRPEFTDLRALLVKHLDFDRLTPLIRSDSPVLLVGAVDVLSGDFKVFTSRKGEVNVDALLASAAIPTLFPAVWADGHPYWDGIFSSNPPVVAFLRKALTGSDNRLPNEIWIIQVNPSQFDCVPELPAEIVDRRNHLAGNLSLRHELQLVEMVNMLLDEHVVTDSFRARFGFDVKETIKVRFIRMSPKLQRELDYPSKLSRRPKLIATLIADGEAQANAFLDNLWNMESSGDRRGGEASPEIH